MKKIASVIFAFLAVSFMTFAASAMQVTAGLPDFNITVNGIRIDNQNRQYPLIVYNEITYFPMTYYDCRFLGLTSEWDNLARTLNIKKDDVNGPYNSQAYTNTDSGYFPVNVCDFSINVNGKPIDNKSEEYPLLNYRDVTYFPLTWRFAYEEFGWNYSYVQGVGLSINSGNSGNTGAGTSELSTEQIYANCSPAVFYIEIYDQYGKIQSSGSGFFIDNYGTAVTNFHVIEDAYSAKIQLAVSGVIHNVLGVYDYSRENDWAVIQTDCYTSVSLVPEYYVPVNGGETIYAIGSPEGLQNTISQGIVSNPARFEGGTTYIQITAPISHGSSGGALINKYGRVVGITSAGYAEGQNLNFAIPITALAGHSTAYATPLNSFNKATSIPTFRPTYTPSYSSPYYSEFYGIPDFGKIVGAVLDEKLSTATAYGYFYYPTFDADMIDVYMSALEKCGFSYYDSYKDDYGATQIVFTNYYLGYNVTFGVSYRTGSYLVMITRAS